MPRVSDDDEDSGDIVTRNGKIKRSSDDLNLPVHPEEINYRKKHPISRVVDEYPEDIICASCGNDLINQVKDGEEVHRHPCLSVLVCETCETFYNSGDFSVDSEEEERYCRWCGNGGKLLVCSKCVCGFCLECIKRNFGSKTVRDIGRDDDWLCLLCEPSPLYHLRQVADLSLEHARNVRKQRREKRKLKIKLLKEKKLKKLSKKPKLAPEGADLVEPPSEKRRRIRQLRDSDTEGSTSKSSREENNSPVDTSYSQSPSPNLSEMSLRSERSTRKLPSRSSRSRSRPIPSPNLSEMSLRSERSTRKFPSRSSRSRSRPIPSPNLSEMSLRSERSTRKFPSRSSRSRSRPTQWESESKSSTGSREVADNPPESRKPRVVEKTDAAPEADKEAALADSSSSSAPSAEEESASPVRVAVEIREPTPPDVAGKHESVDYEKMKNILNICELMSGIAKKQLTLCSHARTTDDLRRAKEQLTFYLKLLQFTADLMDCDWSPAEKVPT